VAPLPVIDIPRYEALLNEPDPPLLGADEPAVPPVPTTSVTAPDKYFPDINPKALAEAAPVVIIVGIINSYANLVCEAKIV
jgi:hypothetical protein